MPITGAVPPVWVTTHGALSHFVHPGMFSVSRQVSEAAKKKALAKKAAKATKLGTTSKADKSPAVSRDQVSSAHMRLHFQPQHAAVKLAAARCQLDASCCRLYSSMQGPTCAKCSCNLIKSAKLS